MKNTIEFLLHPRANMGWHYCSRVIEYLGKGDYNIPFIYSFETNELLIVDNKLLEILKFLQIPYDLRMPTNSVKYIKGE